MPKGKKYKTIILSVLKNRVKDLFSSIGAIAIAITLNRKIPENSGP